MEAVINDRVRYHETDTGGGAGERVFIYWFDAARAAIYRKFDGLISKMSAGEIAVKTDELYFINEGKNLSYDNRVEIKANFRLDSGAIRFDYLISFENDGTVIAKGYSVHSLYRNSKRLEENDLKDLLKKL